jgi:hypothetical protein
MNEAEMIIEMLERGAWLRKLDDDERKLLSILIQEMIEENTNV